MARVLNKIIELLTNNKKNLQEDESTRSSDLSASLQGEISISAEESADLVPFPEKDAQKGPNEANTTKIALTTKEQAQVADYCDEKRVKYKISEVSFILDEMDKVLQEYQKCAAGGKREKLRADLVEGLADAEYVLTEARELSKSTQKCAGELADVCARADFVLRACKHICAGDSAKQADEKMNELTGRKLV